jgi:hypothetical protein
VSDYLENEKSRWGEDGEDKSKPIEEAEDLAPARLLASAFASSDPIAEEYYKLLDAGCSLAKVLQEGHGERKEFVKNELLPVWAKWKARVDKFTGLIEAFEERLDAEDDKTKESE